MEFCSALIWPLKHYQLFQELCRISHESLNKSLCILQMTSHLKNLLSLYLAATFQP